MQALLWGLPLTRFDPCPFLLLSRGDVERYCECNGLAWRELGSADEYRQALHNLARERRGPDWQPPKHPTTEEHRNGPWDTFLWESVFDLTHEPTEWQVILDAPKPYKSLVAIFEASWLPALEVWPVDGQWKELTVADIYFFTVERELVVAIDHEDYGPFLNK